MLARARKPDNSKGKKGQGRARETDKETRGAKSSKEVVKQRVEGKRVEEYNCNAWCMCDTR